MASLKNNPPKILVIGDLILDYYLWGNSERISPEAPVPVVKISDETSIIGGAGNVINNLKALGAKVSLISVIGMCDTSNQIKLLLKDIDVNIKILITEKNRIASKKTRIVSATQQVVRYDQENPIEISKDSQKKILASFIENIGNYDCILLSDYGKGVLTDYLTRELIKIANSNKVKVLVDPKGLNYSKYTGAYLLTPNKLEAGKATQTEINDEKSLLSAITQMKSKYNLSISLITLSESGVAIYDEEFRIHPTSAKQVFDVTGAGDTVLASLGFAISSGMDIDESVKFANLAAGIVIGKIGSSTASINEIKQYELSLGLGDSTSQNFILNNEQIKRLSEEFKDTNQKIVFTNGCFDIIHSGHIKYLEEAKKMGDILIIGLNSDVSVKKLKGNDRPINNQNDRAYVLASLKIVDYVVIFNEKTPYELIKVVQPNILVKGGDYLNKKIIGEDIADEVKIVSFIEGKSTSKIIDTIRNTN